MFPHIHTVPIHVACGELSGVRTETIKSKWRRAFAEAVENPPAIIVLDDIDVLMPTENEVLRPVNVSVVAVNNNNISFSALPIGARNYKQDCGRCSLQSTWSH